MKDEELVEVGIVTKPHGVKGGVFVKTYSGRAESFRKGGIIFVEERKFEVKRVAPFKKGAILKLKGIKNIEEAQALVNKKVFVRKADLPEGKNGEHYWHELLGMDIYNEEGEFLGKLGSILPTGAHDVFVIKCENGKEIMIPYADEFVIEIDRENNRMKVRTHGMEEI